MFEFASESLPFILILTVLVGSIYIWNLPGDRRRARAMAALAAGIGARVAPNPATIEIKVGHHTVHAFSQPKQSIGEGDSSFYIDTFVFEVNALSGQGDWAVDWGPYSLALHTLDPSLRVRLQSARVLELISAVAEPSKIRPVVSFDARRGKLAFTQKVETDDLPSADTLLRTAKAVAQLAEINALANDPQ
jgi:hypothetical protein